MPGLRARNVAFLDSLDILVRETLQKQGKKSLSLGQSIIWGRQRPITIMRVEEEVTKHQEVMEQVDRGQQPVLQRRDRTLDRYWAQRPHQYLAVGIVTARIWRPVGMATNISRLVSEAGVLRRPGGQRRTLRRPGGRWRTPWRLGGGGHHIWRLLEAEADIRGL